MHSKIYLRSLIRVLSTLQKWLGKWENCYFLYCATICIYCFFLVLFQCAMMQMKISLINGAKVMYSNSHRNAHSLYLE